MHDPSIETCKTITRKLEAIVTQTEDLLQSLPGRRKFSLQFRRGWLELQAELVSTRLAKHLSRQNLEQLRACCTRWLHLFRQLEFVASTRPVWNT
ncbi:MAG: hypothetical protein V3W34_03185 [Phycisphaerae bacterium]